MINTHIDEFDKIKKNIETMRKLAFNKDQLIGYLRGKVIEHWADYVKFGRDIDKFRVDKYRIALIDELKK